MTRGKKWEDLRISDDYIFAKVMSDKSLCMEVLELLLNIEIGDIEYIEEQKAIDLDYSAKSIRLDVYTKDNKNIYNVEMQTSDTKELEKRTRYYQGIIDLNSIEKGEYYKNLKETYIVFICTFDLFGKELPKYEFESYCNQDKNIKLEDGTHRIFFNTKAFDKEKNNKLRAFLRYINGEKTEDEFIKRLDKMVDKIKENKELRGEYMKFLLLEQDIFEEGMKKGREEGREEGIKQGMIINQVKILKEFNISKIEIIERLQKDFGITKEEAEKYF